MATMVKEKSRTKKKTKEKPAPKLDDQDEEPLLEELSTTEEIKASSSINDRLIDLVKSKSSSSVPLAQELTDADQTASTQNKSLESSPNVSTSEIEDQRLSVMETASISQNELLDESQAYKDVCRRLDIVSFRDISADCEVPIEQLESKLELTSFLNIQNENKDALSSENALVDIDKAEDTMPSAPTFEEELAVEPQFDIQEVVQEIKPEVQCMPLEVAMQMYGGKEMAEIREMSEREEAIVEAGSLSGPEHPLVDLLSTFRCSVIALEQERHKVMQGYADEEKLRAALWKVEKRTVCESKECPCGQNVWFKGKYDHAELLKSKLPAAKLRLQGLLKDVQESFCHHQHAAFLAYFQIEEYVSETLQSNKSEIRAATALVLHELRMSDTAPAALSGLLCGALRRWAAALGGGLVDAREPRHLLFLLHQLFRQSRSIRWAAPLIKVPMCDSSDAARALALLDLLLAGPTLESARECTEVESTEMWEEVDIHGGGGAVSEGALRERDLLALLRAFPLRALAARLALLARADITQTREYEWQAAGRDVLRALCGMRALLDTMRRAAAAHAQYPRLRDALRAVAQSVLHAAAALHDHNKESYSADAARLIEAELEALFCAGWWGEGPPPPASLLRPAARAAYCAALVVRLHEKSPLVIEQLSLELPAAPCARAVAAAAQAAAGCADHDLARLVLDFLAQTALKRKSPACAGACDAAAREWLPRLLRAHQYLYTTTLHIVAELCQVAPIQPSAGCLKFLKLQRWRPSPGEARGVLDDWSQRCPQLIPCLLHELSYTPYDGVSLEAQLAVGSWLCAQPAPAPEWAWAVLTRLRVHRSSWQLPLDAPPPEHTRDVFQKAYAVLSSSWGHSVPVICEYGVGALCAVAAAQAPVAAHALPLVMAVMASSPESVSLTPRFTELVSTLLAPSTSLVQWARGARPTAPALLLRRALAQVENQAAARGAAAAAWLHALRGAALPGAALAACDALLLAARRPPTLQEAPEPEMLSQLVRNAQYAPLACEEALRAAHAHRERDTQLFAKLLRALAVQRANNHKIHVDNALKQIGSSIGSEELVIHQTAAAALAAPTAHPAHLSLWALFMHLYLHSHTNTPDTPPIGPLFFEGYTKSWTLGQIKKRLQETIIYHQMQVESFKSLLNKTSEPIPTTSTVPKSKSASPMENLLPVLSISTLMGESSDSSDSEEINESDGDTSDRDDDNSASENEERRRVNVNMLKYHEAAEKVLGEFSRWLEAGSRLRATPHHADLARYIPEPAFQTAWAEQLRSMRPPASSEDDDLRPPRHPPAPPPPPAPLHTAVRWLLKIRDRAGRRSQAPTISSPVDDVNFGNQRELYSLVDKHLNCIETFAKQWSVEAAAVSQLDEKLWPLVSALRVRFSLSPIARSCSNKCAPVMLPLQGHYEWRISEGAAGGIRDNRWAARVALRALCRARPKVARAAAALITIARRIRTLSAAVGVAERAWGCAGAAPDVAPARAALVALLDALADRWLCSDADALCALAARWSACAGSAAQEALCGALLARAAAGAPPAARPRLYTALLRALPGAAVSPQRAFSYLSKFDMSRVCCDEAQRGAMLDALLAAAQHWGRAPAPDLHILVELVGVQTAALTTAPHAARVVLASARAAAAGRLPPAPLAHVARAAARAAPPFDQLGHILRELGVIWWEARAQLKDSGATYHAAYAPHVAALQHALQRAFVAAARELSYAPERVSWYAWAALQESWGAWVAPHAAPPLLPPGADRPEHCAMLKHFVDNLHQIMLDCPGCEAHLLSQVWQWAVQAHLSLGGAPAEHSRVQLADLLLELSALPWREHQCWRANCLPAALQIITTTDVEMQTWVADTLQGVEAASWLRDVADCDVAPTLAALLQLFAGQLRLRDETLEQAAQLPWERLPDVALDQALERFFVEHHNPLLPYHAAPQFRVILAATGLTRQFPRARGRRACAVSQWTRAASAPPLLAHAAAHAQSILAVITALEPYIEESSDELEELLSRAVVIMCMEPAANAALPVWERWAARAARRCAGAGVCAARALTSLEYFAPLADAAVAAFLDGGGSWAEASARLRGGGWAGPGAMLVRARLHAAYALALAAPDAPALPTTVNYSEKELIVSVWICALCRAALGGGGGGGGAGGARALLTKWAEPPRLAILRVLGGADQPTDKHRVLSRLALCILTPGSEPLIKAYESACPGVLGSHPDTHCWARAPAIKLLPTLAVKLFPAAENYFAEEMKMASDL